MIDAPSFDLDAYLTQTAAALDLPIERDILPNVKAHVEIVFRHARAVLDFPIPDEGEPAPVFGA